MSYNETIKRIRESKGISQRQITDGILSQSNYSKFENGHLDIMYTSFFGIIDHLELELDEFMFIHRGYAYSEKESIFRRFFLEPYNNLEQLEAIKNDCTLYLKTKSDSLISIILTLCETFITLHNTNDISAARTVAQQLVDEFTDKNILYMKDIILISSIFFVFDLKTAHLTMHYIETALEKYRHFSNTNRILVNLYLNYSLMLIKNNDFEQALVQLEKALPIAKGQK